MKTIKKENDGKSKNLPYLFTSLLLSSKFSIFCGGKVNKIDIFMGRGPLKTINCIITQGGWGSKCWL